MDNIDYPPNPVVYKTDEEWKSKCLRSYDIKIKIEDKLYLNKSKADTESHIKLDLSLAKDPRELEPLLFICPAEVYHRDEVKGIAVSFEIKIPRRRAWASRGGGMGYFAVFFSAFLG
mgnify:CR=1 FL=1